MSRAKELAQALRRMSTGFVGDRPALAATVAFLDSLAAREEGPAAEESEVEALRKWAGDMATGRLLVASASIGHDVLHLLDAHARDRARIAAALAVVEEWEAGAMAAERGERPVFLTSIGRIARVKEALTK